MKKLNVQFVIEKFNLTGNHDTTELEQPVKYAKLTGRSLDYTMMKTQISNEELYDIIFLLFWRK